jgi:hypothetical protein
LSNIGNLDKVTLKSAIFEVVMLLSAILFVVTALLIILFSLTELLSNLSSVTLAFNILLVVIALSFIETVSILVIVLLALLIVLLVNVCVLSSPTISPSIPSLGISVSIHVILSSNPSTWILLVVVSLPIAIDKELSAFALSIASWLISFDNPSI